MKRKLRMGMVGGGEGAFIGGVHRMAANLDGQMELVAGCFSSDAEKSQRSGEALYLDPGRVYGTYAEMAEKEAALPETERIDFVSIVVRNDLHFAVAKTFLEAGFHVICDKPMTHSLEEGLELREVVRDSGKVFVLTHNYTGYPMVKEAREQVRCGNLGKLLKVVVEYPQGYAVGAVSEGEGKISNWRADPSVAGISNCMGDIGTHAFNLARYISGLELEALCSDLTTFIPGRELDDDGNVLLRFKDGAKGILYASQISNGDENNLNIRLYGTRASLEWRQEDPNDLVIKAVNEPRRIHRRGNDYLSKQAQAFTRLPFGHPEAFIEAFANIYLEAGRAIRDAITGVEGGPYDFPGVEEGVEGMRFIRTVVESSKAQAWRAFGD
ncbi:MAG TPA: Gfo/Idh/MocA family oxidoreductase [Oceanipulchritudo sp.]|nr:Gfo/Idh/MocA family oxidoreductase [Oceanipulchritudo sp.]